MRAGEETLCVCACSLKICRLLCARSLKSLSFLCVCATERVEGLSLLIKMSAHSYSALNQRASDERGKKSLCERGVRTRRENWIFFRSLESNTHTKRW